MNLRFHCITTFRNIAPGAKTSPQVNALLLFVTAIAAGTALNFPGARLESERRVRHFPATSSATLSAVWIHVVPAAVLGLVGELPGCESSPTAPAFSQLSW